MGKFSRNMLIVLPVVLAISCTGFDFTEEDLAEGEHKEVRWDQTSLKKVAPFHGEGPDLSYPRMEQLEDGSFLVIYESVTKGSLYIKRSTDQGMTWSLPQPLFAPRNGINAAAPEILQLHDGSLLAAANMRPAEPYEPGRTFGILVRKSRDGGYTWEEEALVYEAGHTFDNGCWEPAFLQLPDGEVQLYFANEAPYGGAGEQNISMIRSYDNGESWSGEPEIVSYRQNSRDGMPVPLGLQGTDEILLAIEDKFQGEFKPTLIRERVSSNWSGEHVGSYDDRREYNPLEDYFPEPVYAGAPYLEQLMSGDLLLSLQTTYLRGENWENSTMMVFIGDADTGKFFRGTYPFDIPPAKRALWNSLLVAEDGRIIALTSTNAFSEDGSTEIWMVTGAEVSYRE